MAAVRQKKREVCANTLTSRAERWRELLKPSPPKIDREAPGTEMGPGDP